MSQEARDRLCGALVFQHDSQRSDLESVGLTSTYLIGLLTYLVFQRGWPIEITAVRTDHHDDSGLAPAPEHIGTHARGWAVDCWPLYAKIEADYIDAGNPRFQRFLQDCAQAPFLKQIGLGGSAYTPHNVTAAGDTVFQDSVADHIHLGARP